MLGGPLNVFRLSGDLSHLASFVFLFHKLYKARSVEGISKKTQELYLLVFLTRYLDVFIPHSHLSFLYVYNTLMKIFFIVSSASIVYRFNKTPWKATYNQQEDSFRHWLFLAVPCIVLALLLNVRAFSVMEVLYSFSIVLEAVTILPQLVMLQRHKNVENLTANFVAALGLYRGLYIVNWIYRYVMDGHVTEYQVWIAGVIQTILYADFFYYYYVARKRGMKLVLPT